MQTNHQREYSTLCLLFDSTTRLLFSEDSLIVFHLLCERILLYKYIEMIGTEWNTKGKKSYSNNISIEFPKQQWLEEKRICRASAVLEFR